jgi:hypothetical protein
MTGLTRSLLRLEQLERRDAPATLVNPTTVTYQDVDGDHVTVKVSKGTLDSTNLYFDNSFATASGQQLEFLFISNAEFQGAAVTVTAVRSAVNGGDGLANVGWIYAASRDLAAVKVDGDLGRIDAGDATLTTPGLLSLTAQSLGRFGTSTGAPDLESTIQGKLGALTVKSDVVESFVNVTGGADGKIGKVFVGGSLSSKIAASGDIGAVLIQGDVIGGVGTDSGNVRSGGAIPGGVTIGGSLIGGIGMQSGLIFTVGNLGPVKINGDVRGGSGPESGRIFSVSALASVAVGGSLVGGLSERRSGEILTGGNLGPVKIAGDVEGRGQESGRIVAGGSLKSVTVGGSLIGSSQPDAGYIRSTGNLGRLIIRGNLIGGSVVGSALPHHSGYIQGQRIASVFVGGSIIAGASSGTLFENASIRAVDDLGPITVKGSLIGNSINRVILSARRSSVPTATSDLAIKSLTVGGRVEFTRILAGYGVDLNPLNGDAQIGTVTVGTDWIASDLAASVVAGADGLFGTGDDALIAEAGGNDPNITAKINSIWIKGQALGTSGGVDHFGFVAQQVGSFKVGNTSFGLTPGKSNDTSVIDPLLAVGATGDLRIHEVA